MVHLFLTVATDAMLEQEIDSQTTENGPMLPLMIPVLAVELKTTIRNLWLCGGFTVALYPFFSHL